MDDDRLILATLGKEEIADCGEAALELAGAGRFDLALLGVRMPGLSGIELARRSGAEYARPTLSRGEPRPKPREASSNKRCHLAMLLQQGDQRLV